MSGLRKSIASLACGAVLFSGAAPAQANSNCDLIKAFTSKDGQGLRKLSIATTKDGTFDIAVSGKKSALREASECEISGPLNEFELRCEWDFDGDGAAAESRARALSAILAPCFAEGLKESSPQTGSKVREYSADIVVTKGDDEFDVGFEISVRRYSNSYNLEVEIRRDS